MCLTCHRKLLHRLAKKVAYVELGVHLRAPQQPDHPAVMLREAFHHFLLANGGVQQVREKAPAPATRDIRDGLTGMGFKGKGQGKGSQ